MRLITIIIFITIITFIVSPSFAAESTPSADIKSKLEELKKAIASKAAKLKGEVNRKLNNKAYVGEVKTKSPTSLTLASSSGPKLININQDTVFESKVKGKKFSQKALAEEDYIAALGDVDETGVLTAKKIILLSQPKPSTKTYIWGQIVSVSDKLSTLKDRTLKNIAVYIPSGTNVKLNEFIIATGEKNENDIFEAEFVYVIPKGGILKPKKVATPSANPR